MVEFALLASVLILGSPEPRVLTIKFDAGQSWPKEISILRGTVLRFQGKADSRTATAFVVRDAGKTVGRATTSADWAIDWSTSSAPAGPSVLEIAFQRGGEEEDLMGRIDLQVLDQSPFSFTPAGAASNGDPLVKLAAGTSESVQSLQANVAGKDVTCLSKDKVRFELPISGLPPGARKVSLTVITAPGAAFDCGELDISVPERIAFKDAKPLIVERTPDTDGNAVRLDCVFKDGLTSSSVDVDLKPGGVFIPREGGGQVILAMDSLPEGSRSVSLQATGPDGTIYLSTPRELQVHSTPGYVTFRALQNCDPVFEDCSQYLQAILRQAVDADLAVRNGGDGREAAQAWDQAQEEIADAILNAHGQEPEGFAQADTAKVVPGLNHVYQNWLLYGAILTRDLGDSWRGIPLDDYSRFSNEVRTRARYLQLADQAVSDASDAKHNLLAAYARIAGDLPVDHLQVADPFDVQPALRQWIKRRASVFQILGDALGTVNEASALDPAQARLRESYIKSIQPNVPLSDGGSRAFYSGIDALAAAIEQMAEAREYAAQKQAIVARYSGDLSNVSTADQQRLDLLDREIETCGEQRDTRLNSGMMLFGRLLDLERMAVTRSDQ